jgi:hypothetical protein
MVALEKLKRASATNINLNTLIKTKLSHKWQLTMAPYKKGDKPFNKFNSKLY